ncbi:MAG: hypothetical protein QXE01_07075 [Sulfolobales archaeon]
MHTVYSKKLRISFEEKERTWSKPYKAGSESLKTTPTTEGKELREKAGDIQT